MIDCPRAFTMFFFSLLDFPNLSITKVVLDRKHQISAVTNVIWSNILLSNSEFRLINTRANKMKSNSRIIIFCHLWESEMQKWSWARIHRCAGTSSKETSNRYTQKWHTKLPIPSPEKKKHP